ncbi:MAG TPA: hypothetical protein VGJ60_28585 [Chloroflexota bacterium]
MLYVDIPTLAEFRALADTRADMCVSLCVPTSPLPQEAAMSRTELGNLARTALNQLVDAGSSRARVDALRDALADLDQDEQFWRYQANSLAVLATPDSLRTFRLPNRLTPIVEVADRFYLKPLLRAITFPHEAFVLALSENAVRLVEVFADLPAQRVSVADLPASAADAVGRSTVNERSPRGRLQGSEGQKVLLTQYARQVNAALRPVLAGRDAPVILASVEPLASLFRGISTVATLAPQTISGSPERLSDAELATQARPILDDLYAQTVSQLRESFEQRRAQGRAIRDVAEAARAATFGMIETLLVDIDVMVPGTVDETDGRITLGEERPEQTYGVVDEIARRALLSGARVLGVRAADLPSEAGAGPLAATLRYPL